MRFGLPERPIVYGVVVGGRAVVQAGFFGTSCARVLRVTADGTAGLGVVRPICFRPVMVVVVPVPDLVTKEDGFLVVASRTQVVNVLEVVVHEVRAGCTALDPVSS